MSDDLKKYIFDGYDPVVCDDELTWREFMRSPENVLIAKDSVESRYTVITTFLGFNKGTTEDPVFFQTSVLEANGHSHGSAATLEQAKSNHARNLRGAVLLAQYFDSVENGTCKSFKPIDIIGYPNEIHFQLESEQAAIDELPEDTARWKRRGDTIVFIVTLSP